MAKVPILDLFIENFLSNAADGQLDDVEFNVVKKIFATEVKLDYHKIGKKDDFFGGIVLPYYAR